MTRSSARRAAGVFALALTVVLLDFGIGALLERVWPATLPPGDPVASYRVESTIYHHDLRPNVEITAEWGAARYRLITNSLGFRDAVVREIAPVPTGRRVVLIGDSFTEGVGLPFEQTYAGLVAAALGRQGIEVLDAGVVSYSPSIYERKIRFLIEERHLAFDELVVFLDVSDIEDEALYYSTAPDGRIVDAPSAPENGVLRRGNPPPERPWWSWTASGRLLQLVKHLTYGSGGWRTPLGSSTSSLTQRLTSDDRAAWTVNEAAFRRFGELGLERCRVAMDSLLALLRAHGIQLTLVVYPWPAQLVAHDRNSKQEIFWRAWADAHGVDFVDLFPELLVDGDAWPAIHRWYLPWDVHFSAEGSALVAAEVIPVLEAHARAADALLHPGGGS